MGFCNFITYPSKDGEKVKRFKAGSQLVLGNVSKNKIYLIPNTKGKIDKCVDRKKMTNEIKRTVAAFNVWSRYDFDDILPVKRPGGDEWLIKGFCSSIQYTSDKEGKMIPYIHEFKKNPKLYGCKKTQKGRFLNNVFMLSPTKVTARGIVG